MAVEATHVTAVRAAERAPHCWGYAHKMSGDEHVERQRKDDRSDSVAA